MTETPLRRLLAYFRPYRGRAAAALLAMGIVSLSTVALLFLLTKIIDDVLGAGTAAALPGLGGAPGKAAAFVRWLDSIYSAGLRAAEAAGVPVRLAVPMLLLAALISKNVFSYFSEFAFNGIGLSMVYRIVQLHDGEIEVHSTPGRGTTFAIRFPLHGRPAASRPT